jgi:hypothetical protein
LNGPSNSQDATTPPGVLDQGLEALITQELERIHAEGYVLTPQGEEIVDSVGPAVWSEVPWDEE